MLEYFANETRKVAITIYAEGQYVDGEWRDGAAGEPLTRSMIEIPITPAQSKQLPEGSYTAQDKKFYHHSKELYPSGSLFECDGIFYQVGDITDRRREGGFVLYYGKREVKENA